MNGFNFLQSLATKGGTYSPLRAFSFRLSQVCFESCEQMDAVLLRFRLIRRLRSNVKMLIIVIIIIFSLSFFCSFFVHLKYTTVTFVHVCMLVRVVAKYICCTFRRIYFLVCQPLFFFLNRVFVWFFSSFNHSLTDAL